MIKIEKLNSQEIIAKSFALARNDVMSTSHFVQLKNKMWTTDVRWRSTSVKHWSSFICCFIQKWNHIRKKLCGKLKTFTRKVSSPEFNSPRSLFPVFRLKSPHANFLRYHQHHHQLHPQNPSSVSSAASNFPRFSLEWKTNYFVMDSYWISISVRIDVANAAAVPFTTFISNESEADHQRPTTTAAVVLSPPEKRIINFR